MKHRKTYVILGVLALIWLTSSMILASAADPVEYYVKSGESYYYECTYATNTIVKAQTQNKDPTSVTLIRIDVVDALVNTNKEETHAFGSMNLDIWYLESGANWALNTSDMLVILDSNNLYTFGLVAFEDAKVTTDQILSFFLETPFLIPNPKGLSDTQWTALKQNLEANLFYSYGKTYVAEVDDGDRKLTVKNVIASSEFDFNLEITYSSKGYLQEYNLYAEYINNNRDKVEHTVFKAERLVDTYDVQDVPPEDYVTPYVIGGIVAAVAIVIIVIWRKNR